MDRTCDQDDAGADRKQRRHQGPPEAGRLSRPEQQSQFHQPADQEQPPKEDCDGEACKRRDEDRRESESDQQATLDQEGPPMLLKDCLQRAAIRKLLNRHFVNLLQRISGAPATLGPIF
jgi:hypothetical protein